MANKVVFFLACLILLLALAKPANAFGAGNIASISKIEGRNWRHGDIEDMLETVAHLRGYKWTAMMIKRVYFGNWLRDYSQAVDVGTLKGVQANAIRILVWILSFISFGYATREFEVTEERLGVYRPEEHIDNPEDYADNIDARQYDKRLRGPVRPEELAIDPDTGMKNYVANDRGDWATSSGYVRFSFTRSIHYGRLFTSGAGNTKGRQEDLFEALRCLGQGLHCLEDFGAHTNYTELALRELGFHNVFPHTGTATEMMLHGRRLFPLVTGTFGGVDFLHSVLGEAGDHVTQAEVSEVDQMKDNMTNASKETSRGGGNPEQQASGLTDLLSKVPGCGDLCHQAVQLQRDSNAQKAENAYRGVDDGVSTRDDAMNMPPPPPPQQPPPMHDPMMSGAQPPQQQPGTQPQPAANIANIDLQATVQKIYPILEFRDNVVRSISAIVEKIPGLEKLIETISERITLFIMGLLAPYIVPVINAASAQLKTGSSTVVKASADHQYAPWTDPLCTAPTHSMLSKDHFSNMLNNPAGQIATAILQYAAPRVIYAWENPGVPVEQVLDDIVGPAGAFHHPALRRPDREIHQNMFHAVQHWVDTLHDKNSINEKLSSESVRHGKNHMAGAGGVLGSGQTYQPNESANIGNLGGFGGFGGQQQHAGGHGAPIGQGGHGSGGGFGGLASQAGQFLSGGGGGGHGGGGGGGNIGQVAGKLLGSFGQSSGGGGKPGGGAGQLLSSVLGSREGPGGERGAEGAGGFEYGSVAPDATVGTHAGYAGQHLAPGYGAFGAEGAQSTYEAMQQRRSVSPYPEQGGYAAPAQQQEGEMFGYEHQAYEGGGYQGEYGGYTQQQQQQQQPVHGGGQGGYPAQGGYQGYQGY